MENVRNYKSIKLVSKEMLAQRYANRSSFKSYTILDEDLVCLDLIQEEITLNKPSMLEWCVPQYLFKYKMKFLSEPNANGTIELLTILPFTYGYDF